MKYFIVAALLLAALFAAVRSSDAQAAAAPLRPHTACAQEDSAWCVWDASSVGNHQGHSFWSDHANRVHYCTDRYARRLLRTS